MKRGRKPIPADEKSARSTWRKDRDAGKVQLILAADNPGPLMPDFMLDDTNPLATIARSIWAQFHPLVTALGCNEGDSNLFARYCFLEANCRTVMAVGELPSMNKMSQLRQMEELLRIAGPKSRIGQKTAGPDTNPFRQNGRKGA